MTTSRAARKFTILDSMILVAAVACGFALHRAASSVIASEPKWVGPIPQQPPVVVYLRQVMEWGYPLLVPLTLAVLVMRLRRPRPRWRRLLRQPGMAACCAAVVPIVLSLVGLGRLIWILEPPEPSFTLTSRRVYSIVVVPPIGEIFGAMECNIGLWVLGACLILILARRWRSERSAIDRLGRIVGIGWILMLVVHAVYAVVG